jgi:FAD/FMN-containing dehydrogenase
MSYASWGNYPLAHAKSVLSLRWRHEPLPEREAGTTLLPYGLGRSYGDSCLNDGGTLVDASGLDRFIAFDPASGLLRCEAGVTHAGLIAEFVPRGWFPPVTPGTRWVTVGGSIANDIHGKNHHHAGSFGCHLSRFELLRSNGERLVCSPDEHGELFRATIGGLGLTGLITWAEIRLRRIPGPLIERESVKLGCLDEFFEQAAEHDARSEYTVAWIDCLARGKALGRGLFFHGEHRAAAADDGGSTLSPSRLVVPLDAPQLLLSPPVLRAFNTLYYHRQLRRRVRRAIPLGSFFYPLDSIRDWNRLYGKRGFMQHQSVVPHRDGKLAVGSLLRLIADAGLGSFLAVLKVLGERDSGGLLSFPRPGLTLALDFPNRGRSTFELLDRLDAIVREHGGRVYPAKDARMSSATFRDGYPRWEEFSRWIDPAFSSSFWRRVTASGNGRR